MKLDVIDSVGFDTSGKSIGSSMIQGSCLSWPCKDLPPVQFCKWKLMGPVCPVSMPSSCSLMKSLQTPPCCLMASGFVVEGFDWGVLMSIVLLMDAAQSLQPVWPLTFQFCTASECWLKFLSWRGGTSCTSKEYGSSWSYIQSGSQTIQSFIFTARYKACVHWESTGTSQELTGHYWARDMHVFWARVLQERPRLCDDRCKSSWRWMGGGIAKLRVGFGSSGLFAQDGPWWGSAIRVPHLWQPIGELLRTKPWMDSMDCYCGLGYPWPWFNLIRIRFALTAKSSKYENLFEFVVLSSSAVLCTAWEFRGSEAQSSWKYVVCIGNGVPLMFEPLHAVQTTWWSILAAHSPEWEELP